MTEKWVCSNCFDEEGIKAFIALNGEIDTCFFCSGQSTCIPIECIADHIMECLRPHYTDEPEGVYDMEEGIIWEQLDPFDILDQTVFLDSDMLPNYDNPICLELRKAFGDGIWTLKDPYGEEYWWGRFSKVVKHKRRFFFLGQDLKEEEPSIRGNPEKLLSATLKDCMDLLNKNENLTLFRCRYQKPHEQLENLDDFLSPPPEKATMSNRMNPPGIPHLYGATDVNTAFEETKREKGTYKIAELITKQPLMLVDLTNLSPIPSMFHPNKSERKKFNRHTLIHKFEKEICKQINRDDRVNFEYVPSQILCEYIKEKAPNIDGIMYKSNEYSLGINICLFLKRECLRKILCLKEIRNKNYD